MSRVGIAHHHSAITVGGAHPTATFSWTFVSQRLMTVHQKMLLLTHPHPDPPLEGDGNSLSLMERVRVRVGIFMRLCEPLAHGGSSDLIFYLYNIMPFIIITCLTLCNRAVRAEVIAKHTVGITNSRKS